MKHRTSVQNEGGGVCIFTVYFTNIYEFLYFWCTSENFGLMVVLKNKLATKHIDQPLRTMNMLYKH